MNYFVWTIGCQMNAADSRQASEELEWLGYRQVTRPEDADLILLNTCVVRQSAEDKVIGRLTSLQGLKRRRPALRLAVMGCFVPSEAEIPALQERYPWVDAFIEPSDVAGVTALAKQQWANRKSAGNGTTLCHQQIPRPDRHRQVSVGVPISQGCDHHCTYCIVRLRRGPEVSRPVDEIVAEVEDLASSGVKEITLLGQNVDSYGHDLPSVISPPPALGSQAQPQGGATTLADLLEAVHETKGIQRIRFLTSHPADMTNRLIEATVRLAKVCEHFEVPVQSGDDTVLRRMGRGYTVDQYRDLVTRIRQAFRRGGSGSGAGLTTDVIVGFPGETDAQFQATYRLLAELRFDMVHVAAYSPRPGTPASRLVDDVPAAEKERRRRAVDDLQKRIVGGINAQYLGQTVEVLVEDRRKGKWRGRTRTNKLVFFDVNEIDWTGELVSVRITWAGPWSMQGVVENP